MQMSIRMFEILVTVLPIISSVMWPFLFVHTFSRFFKFSTILKHIFYTNTSDKCNLKPNNLSDTN